MRIATLLPSATEIVACLGLADQIVGVSHECDFPAGVAGRPVLTEAKLDPGASAATIHGEVTRLVEEGLSVYRVFEDRLAGVEAELVVTQDTCQICAVAFPEVLEATRRVLGPGVEVVSLSPSTVEQALDDVRRVATAAGVPERGREVAARLRRRLDDLAALTAPLAEVRRPRVLHLEWLQPPMTAGHWTPELIRIAGGEPVLGFDGAPTRSLPWDELLAAEVDLVMVAPCGFDLARTREETHQALRETPLSELPAVRDGHLWIADGNAYFNRPGPRLVESAEIMARACHGGSVALAPEVAAGLERVNG